MVLGTRRNHLSRWHTLPAGAQGFLGNALSSYKNDVPLFEVKMNIWGKLTITPLKEAHHIYSIKYTGYGKEGYSLTNYKDEILATVASKFTWKSFKETYTLSAQADFAATESGRLLITLLAYHYRGMQQVAVNTGMVAAG